jgi:hypothetical protein
MEIYFSAGLDLIARIDRIIKPTHGSIATTSRYCNTKILEGKVEETVLSGPVSGKFCSYFL